jgi:hypothetical protein
MGIADDRIVEALNAQAAELAIMRLLLNAALRQLPNQRLLLSNFREMAEDNEVRAMYSSSPETFFEEFRRQRAAWEARLDDVITSTTHARRGGS